MKAIHTILIFFVCSLSIHAGTVDEKDWGIAVGISSANILYPTKEDRVNDFIPFMFYDGDLFFVRGLTGGIKLYNKDKWTSGSWELLPYATLRYKSADFNDYYYGLDGFSDPKNPLSAISFLIIK